MRHKLLLSFIFLHLFLLSLSFSTYSLPSWITSSDNNKHKWAIVPSYTRNSTYGHSFGGRAFIYPSGNTGYYTSLEGMVSEDLFFSTAFSYKYWRKNGDQFHLESFYDGFSEPYYGEGDKTLPGEKQDIPIHKVHIGVEYVFSILSDLYSGFFTAFDYREETSEKELFPSELLVSGGVLLRYDTRDNYFNPSKGEYYEVRSWFISRLDSPLFLETDIRLFFSLSQNFIIALRGATGAALINSPRYLYKFSLGGPHLLRGYRLNRFRGDYYYLSQTELRYTLLKWLMLTSFFDFGSAANEISFPPRYSFGGGLRFGLPPDFNKNIRVEFGLGEDQFNFVVAFGHPF